MSFLISFIHNQWSKCDQTDFCDIILLFTYTLPFLPDGFFIYQLKFLSIHLLCSRYSERARYIPAFKTGLQYKQKSNYKTMYYALGEILVLFFLEGFFIFLELTF